MIWLSLYLIVPLVGLAQALFWPTSLELYQTFVGRLLFGLVLTGHAGLILLAYWMRFQRISAFSIARANVRLCYVGALLSVATPFATLGLSKVAVNSPSDIRIEFGEAAWASMLGLVICLFALKDFTQQYTSLWQDRAKWLYPDEE